MDEIFISDSGRDLIMKITPGISDGSLHRAGSTGKSTAARNSQQPSQIAVPRGDISGGQRGVSEAMSIVNTARSIVNRALTVSSQLQSIARQAMSSGSVDRAELSNAISSINLSMSQAEGAPAVAVISPAILGEGSESRPRMEIPSAVEELSTLRRMAGVLDAGGSIDEEALGEVNGSLTRKSRSFAELVGALENAYRGLAGGEGIADTQGAERAVRDLSALISASPSGAMSVQGNIRPENVINNLA